MKRILYIITSSAAVALMSAMTAGCRIPPPSNDGDTVAACEFEPADTAAKTRAVKAAAAGKAAAADSVGVYYIGDGSTRERLQLVSYPSRRDTLVYSKTRHVRVKGSAAFGSVVRVRFYLLNGTDSLVSAVENVAP